MNYTKSQVIDYVKTLDKTIRTNGGKPVKYRSRMEDYAK